jgi:hypothetical protein
MIRLSMPLFLVLRLRRYYPFAAHPVQRIPASALSERNFRPALLAAVEQYAGLEGGYLLPA